MIKDRRYTTAKNLILGGYLKTINELFDTVPKTTVARDLGTNLARLNKMISSPLLYTLGDLVKIATLIDIDETEVVKLAVAQYAADKKGRKKK